jgi:hypothetical protein
VKILRIHRYGTLTFNADGSAHVDGWGLKLDEDRYPQPDELALMLFEFLAAQTREHILARAHISVETPTQ